MGNYNKLEINDTTLYFKRVYDGRDDFDTDFFTINGKKKETKWSWRQFKRIPTGRMVDNYVRRFTLYLDIEDARHTKGYVREKLEHKLELLGRQDEIKRGELV